MYETVDLKVKIITKSQSKQSVMKNQVSMQEIDAIVADDNGNNNNNNNNNNFITFYSTLP